MHQKISLRFFAAGFAAFLGLSSFAADARGKHLNALIITGGCCHNYKLQAGALTNAIGKVADVTWKIVNDGGSGTKAEIEFYQNPDWAKPYDVIIHNECFADTTDPGYIRKITSAHKAGKPAIVIHCAMHTYRAATIDDWREFLGVTSRMHEHQSKYPVKPVAKDHPIMQGFPELWTTPMDELYIIEKVWPKTTPLAVSVSERSGKEQPVIWTSDYFGARIFGTTYGHSDETFRDPVFLNLLARAFLWTAGR